MKLLLHCCQDCRVLLDKARHQSDVLETSFEFWERDCTSFDRCHSHVIKKFNCYDLNSQEKGLLPLLCDELIGFGAQLNFSRWGKSSTETQGAARAAQQAVVEFSGVMS